MPKFVKGSGNPQAPIDKAFRGTRKPNLQRKYPTLRSEVIQLAGKKMKVIPVNEKTAQVVMDQWSQLDKKTKHHGDPFIEGIRKEIEGRRPGRFNSRKAYSERGLTDLIRTDIEDSEMYFNTNILDDLVKRHRLIYDTEQYYKEKWPDLSNRCSVVSTDIADTVEWILPSVMRVFWGGNEIVTINGRTAEDNPEVMKALVNFQLLTKNPGFMIFQQWTRDALESGLRTGS